MKTNLIIKIKTIIICFGLAQLQGMEEPIQDIKLEQIQQLPPQVTAYIESLPRLEKVDSNEPATLAYAISRFLCQFSNAKKEITGLESFSMKIQTHIQTSDPIPFILLGFPIKSANNESKVLGTNIDLGEFVACVTLDHIARQIGSVYKPGARVTIYNKEPFIDQMNKIVKEKLDVELFEPGVRKKYQTQMAVLIEHFHPLLALGKIPHIGKLFAEKYGCMNAVADDVQGYKHFMTEELNCTKFREVILRKMFENKRQELIAQKKLKAPITFEQLMEDKKLFATIQRFLPYKALLNETANELAVCAATGAIRMRKLMSDIIPNYDEYVRLSIHAAANGDVSSKMGINLIFGSEGTPWHKAVVVDKSGIHLEPLAKLVKKDKTLNGEKCKYSLNNALNLEYVTRNK